MGRAINKVGTALKRLRDDGIRPRVLVVLRAYLGWRFFLFGAIVFALVWPASKAAADPLVLEVAEASARFDQQQNAPVINIVLKASSRRPLAEFTTRHLRKFVEFRVDGRVMTRPRIVEPLYSGVVLLGSFNIEEAKDMASRLSSGAARLEVEAASA